MRLGLSSDGFGIKMVKFGSMLRSSRSYFWKFQVLGSKMHSFTSSMASGMDQDGTKQTQV